MIDPQGCETWFIHNLNNGATVAANLLNVPSQTEEGHGYVFISEGHARQSGYSFRCPK